MQPELDLGKEFAARQDDAPRSAKKAAGLSLDSKRLLTDAMRVQTVSMLSLQQEQTEFNRASAIVEDRMLQELPSEEAARDAELEYRKQAILAIERKRRRLVESRKTYLALKGFTDSNVKVAKVAGDQAIDQDVSEIEIKNVGAFRQQLTGDPELTSVH